MKYDITLIWSFLMSSWNDKLQKQIDNIILLQKGKEAIYNK